MPWIIGGAIVGSALLGSNAASSAASGQTDASAAAIAENRRQFDLSRADQYPWLQSGTNALNELNALYGLPSQVPDTEAYNAALIKYNADKAAYETPSTIRGFMSARQLPAPVAPNQQDFMKTSLDPNYDPMAKVRATPGYQFRLGEGLQGVERSAAARGNLFSGANLKALDQYGQDYATNEFGNYANRLANLSGTGQTTATNLGTLGQNYATNYGNNVTGAANAAGAANIAQGNIYGSTLTGLANIYANRPAASPQLPQTWTT